MGGREGVGGGRGGWEAEGGLKQPFRLKTVLCLQCVTQADTIHKGGQTWREEQPGTPCSPINAPQDYEMHLRGFTASIISHL